MKLKTKLILSTLGIFTLAASAFLTITSCTKQPQEDSIAKTYQHEYAKDMSMFLDPNEKEILKITREGKTTAQSYGTFQDLNPKSSTYKGWYLLLRDTSNAKDEIIASFCGWNQSYFRKTDTELSKTKTFSVPEFIELPENYSIDGLNAKTIEVRALGYDSNYNFQGFEKIASSFQELDKFLDYLFFDPQILLDPLIPNDFFTYIFFPSNLDLSLTKIRYIFESCFRVSPLDWMLENSKIIFPSSLIYFAKRSIQLNSIVWNKKNFNLDFSKTQLVEFNGLYAYSPEGKKNNKLDIKLPDSCVRVTYISVDIINSINLKNVLYYGDDTFWNAKFLKNTVKINKKAQYKKEPNKENRFTTFRPNVNIEYY